jgi:Astacin (Peptidase family M12A)
MAVGLAAFSLGLLTSNTRAQSLDPHLPPPMVIPGLDQYVVIDDMLLTPDQHAELTAPPTSRRQAHIPYPLTRQFFWDSGVIPYEIAPNFSPAERQRVFDAMTTWSRTAPITFVPRTSQSGFLAITRDELTGPEASPCFSGVGHRLGTMQRFNLGGSCSSDMGTILHEMGHTLGYLHEQQRLDRDNYVTIDFGNVPGNARHNFDRWTIQSPGPYDFGSIMHYAANAFALDRSRPTIIPKPQYASETARMGSRQLSDTDHNMMSVVYFAQMNDSAIRTPTEPQRSRFDRGDLLLAMERLHAFYMSRMGLQRPQGLSIESRPDFLGIAQWIFDIYLPARSGGFSAQGAFDIVVAAITRTDEWRQKNPGRAPLTPASFRAAVSLNRNEFLDVLNRLDRFYSAPEGLQRPNGLSISGGPDFLGIATWIFDIYLAERLNGISPNGAWTITENAIRATNEWRSKH